MQASWDRYVGLVTHFLLFALTGIQYLVLMTVMLDIERTEKKDRHYRIGTGRGTR